MSYAGSGLSLISQTIEGAQKVYFYRTTDTLASVLGASYFSDATKRGMVAGDVVIYYNTSTGQTADSVVGSVSSGAATLKAAGGTLGAATSSPISFYGTTPTTQPTSANQAAVATTAITAVATTAATSSSPFGFTTSAQANAILSAINSLITSEAADRVLLNQIRSDLVTLGLIKGS